MNISRFLHRLNRKGLIALGVLTLTGGLLAAGFGYSTSRINLKLANPDEGPARYTMAPAARAAMPSVVKISSSKVVKTTGYNGGGQDLDPLFRQFFGNGFPGGGGGWQQPQQPQSHREGGLGSGVIISPDGYILTNNHVVDGATDVEVTLPTTRQQYKARVIGTDKRTDVALIKIEASNLPAITIGNSSKIQIGDEVLAIGNPYGVGQTVTMGIVSAVGRSDLGIEDYEDFIQTDASINPGNSGGALVNDRGELIGINTAILAQESGGNQGIGFAVPINLARQVMDQIEEHGHVTRSYLGVSVQEVTPAIAKDLGLNGPEGALVSDVSPDSPAARAGLRTGDVIVGINGTPIAQRNDLRMKVSLMTPDQTVHLKVFRDGQMRDVDVQLAEMPGEQVASREGARSEQGESALQGVSVEDLDAQTLRQLNLPASTKGVVVTQVDPASPAAEAGLQEGDVIQQVNRQPVTNANEFARAVRHSNGGQSLLLVNRNGDKMFLSV